MRMSNAQQILDHGTQLIRDRTARPVCLSVCDAQGFLIGFVRMDLAPVRSIQIAQIKAYTSARLGTTTSAFRERLAREGSSVGDYGDALLTSLPGGAVILRDGQVCGGVGVSGLAPLEDQALAEELAAFAAALPDT